MQSLYVWNHFSESCIAGRTASPLVVTVMVVVVIRVVRHMTSTECVARDLHTVTPGLLDIVDVSIGDGSRRSEILKNL